MESPHEVVSTHHQSVTACIDVLDIDSCADVSIYNSIDAFAFCRLADRSAARCLHCAKLSNRPKNNWIPDVVAIERNVQPTCFECEDSAGLRYAY